MFLTGQFRSFLALFWTYTKLGWSFKCDANSCESIQSQLSEDSDDLASNFLQELDSTASKTAQNLNITAEVPKTARFLYSLEDKLQLGDQITQAKIEQASDKAEKQKVAEQQAASKNDDILQVRLFKEELYFWIMVNIFWTPY